MWNCGCSSTAFLTSDINLAFASPTHKNLTRSLAQCDQYIANPECGESTVPWLAGPADYFIAVLACTTGSSTALAPDEPRSIDTVAFRKSEDCAKKIFFT